MYGIKLDRYDGSRGIVNKFYPQDIKDIQG